MVLYALFHKIPDQVLSVLMFSSWKLFKTANPETELDFLGYLRCVTCHYLDENKPSCKMGQGRKFPRRSKGKSSWRVDSATRLNGGNHWPKRVSGKFGVHCAVPDCGRRVRTACVTCQVGYCIGQCWEDAHSPN